jgi:malate dehydrogenase (oxaloacetate-decarboxylating)
METYRSEIDEDGTTVVECALRGDRLLSHAMFNKGTGFTRDERDAFGLLGLLPHVVCTIEQQVERVHARLNRKTDPLEKYIGLAALQDRNETLFHRLLLEHLEELMPIVYTPTVGQACQLYSTIFRRGRGLWITPDHQGRIRTVLENATWDDVRLIVVTDNERILGLGDQGAGGMGIPVGKLALYSVAAGFHPTKILPISLDFGTDNVALLSDPVYIGWRGQRLRGARYDALVEEFVEAVRAVFPHALLQWEDFKKGNAFRLLDRYRERLLSFNDDIQGTAAIALAGVLGAARATDVPMREQRVVILGAGAAGIGIARQIRAAFARAGLSGDALTRAICLLDSHGPLIEGRALDEDVKKEFTWPQALATASGLSAAGDDDLLTVVGALKPTVLIGTSGQPLVFSEEIVREMARHVERPAIFPFSNPTSKSEALPSDVIRVTDGRALVATGSPFEPVRWKGETHRIGQGNNVYIFPGVGLGALIARAQVVTDAMFTVAAQTIADALTDDDIRAGALYPSLSRLRELTAEIAARVAVEAGGDTLTLEAARARVKAFMWFPAYPRYRAR